MTVYPNKSAGWIRALRATARRLKWGLAVVCRASAQSHVVMTQLAKELWHAPPRRQILAKLAAHRKGRALKGSLVWLVVLCTTV